MAARSLVRISLELAFLKQSKVLLVLAHEATAPTKFVQSFSRRAVKEVAAIPDSNTCVCRGLEQLWDHRTDDIPRHVQSTCNLQGSPYLNSRTRRHLTGVADPNAKWHEGITWKLELHSNEHKSRARARQSSKMALFDEL
jgi:hypothetical protein